MDLTLVEYQVGRIVGDGACDRTNFLPQEQLDRSALADLGLYLELNADILALDGAKRVVEIARQRLAGRDRYFLSDKDFGFLVVECYH